MCAGTVRYERKADFRSLRKLPFREVAVHKSPVKEGMVTDITYIRTHEGWLYLAVVVDLFSRKIISWPMQSRMTKDIVLNALLMAV